MVYLRHNDALILFGKKVRELRLRQKLTQGQLGYECNSSKNQISRIERGEINTGLSTIVKIAEVLGVHPKELFDF